MTLLRRIGVYGMAAWVAITLNFVIPRLMPGDPASVMFARLQGELDAESLEALRAAYGFSDAPIWWDYLTYLGSVLTGDLGTSVAYFPAPVTEVIGTGLLWTLFLAGTSLVIAFTLGSLLGVAAAWWRGSWVDRVLPPVLAFVSAFPYFWVAMAAVYLFGLELGWFPVRHAYGPEVEAGFNLAFVTSVIRHAILPATTLVIAGLGGWLLAMRNTMVGVLGEPYIQYATARGLPSSRIALAYAARNALLPNLTGFGMALGFVLSGALLTEIVFAYPGQGFLLLQAVRAQDYPLMQGLFLTITLAVLGANFLVDLLVAALDPRTELEG